MIRWLLLLAVMIAGPAHAEWWRAETDHFIIYSEDRRSGTQEFAVELERFDNALRTLQGLPVRPAKELTAPNKVTIFRTGSVSDIAVIAADRAAGVDA